METAQVVIAPRLLVTLFGVPEMVTMPRKLREETVFEAHGITWRCKRLAMDTWSLCCPLHSSRCRFGDAGQIAEDIGHVLSTGALPGQAGNP